MRARPLASCRKRGTRSIRTSSRQQNPNLARLRTFRPRYSPMRAQRRHRRQPALKSRAAANPEDGPIDRLRPHRPSPPSLGRSTRRPYSAPRARTAPWRRRHHPWAPRSIQTRASEGDLEPEATPSSRQAPPWDQSRCARPSLTPRWSGGQSRRRSTRARSSGRAQARLRWALSL